MVFLYSMLCPHQLNISFPKLSLGFKIVPSIIWHHVVFVSLPHNFLFFLQNLLMAHSFLSVVARIIRMTSWVNEALPIFILHPQGLHIMFNLWGCVFKTLLCVCALQGLKIISYLNFWTDFSIVLHKNRCRMLKLTSVWFWFKDQFLSIKANILF